MRRSPLLRAVLVTSAAMLLIGACSSNDKTSSKSTTSTTATTVAAPKDIEIGAGTNDPKDSTIAVLQYMPASVTVAVGTPVNWQWSGTEPHSVTFLAPGKTLPPPGDQSVFPRSPANGPYTVDGTTTVNSGLQPLGQGAPTTFQVSFTKPGTYQYHCVIHPQMSGTINVVAAGGVVDTPAKVATERAADQAKWLAEGRAAKTAFEAMKPVSSKNKDGSTTWTVEMGTSTQHTDILAFSPMSSAIKAGDTVNFVNGSGAPHTASFNVPAGMTPVDPRVDQAIPGKSPEVLTATGFLNTGIVPPDAGSPAPPLIARTFSFKVPSAGTYSFVCLLHSPSGMAGSIDASA